MGTYWTISDCFNKSENQWNFIHAHNDDFMEEICDSDSYLSSENSYFHSGNVNMSVQCQLYFAEDAQSTTSDSSYVEDWNTECEKEVEANPLIRYMIYLQNASDDDLGLPPNLKEDQTQPGFCVDGDLVHGMDLDFDLDVDFDEERAGNHEDGLLFWLSFL